MKVVAGLAALALAVAWLAIDPTVRPDALLRLLTGGSVAAGALFAALGAGGALLRWRAPDVLDRPAGWLAALGVGIGLHAGLMFLMAAAGLAGRVGSGSVLLALACGWAAFPAPGRPRAGPFVLAVGAVMLLPGLVEALAPPTDTDELYQHLSLARLMAERGHLVGGFAHPDGSRPMAVHVVLTSLYAVGGEAAPRLWNLGVVMALLLGVRELAEARFGEGRGALPALVLLGSWSFLREAGMAYNNHVVALWLLIAADALLERRWGLMGWMCGLALAGRYTAAPVVVGLFAVALAERVDLRRLVLGGVFVFVPVVPWWIRNVAEGLHPLFPFAGWPESGEFVFMYPEKYGMGRDALDWVLLPWNVLMHADPYGFEFLGRVNLAWAALAAAGLVAARRDPAARRLAIVVAAGFGGWALGPQLLRYLLPLSGVAALAAGAVRPAWPAWLLWVLSLPANLQPALERATARAAVASGNEAAEVFLEREVTAWPALSFLREHVPADARVALLFSWHGYYVPQDWVLGSVEDHVPSRWWVWSHGDAALRDLAAQGVTHVFVGDTKFIKKAYGFLDADTLRTQFQAPEEALRLLLRRDAVRLFAGNRWEVWRLQPVPEAGLDVPAPTP